MAHVPMEVLMKNFQMDSSAFDHIPSHELYIFPAGAFVRRYPLCVRTYLSSVEPPTTSTPVEDPLGQVPNPFSYPLSKVTPTSLAGGTIKIADSRTFKVAEDIAVADVTVVPGAMRELHV